MSTESSFVIAVIVACLIAAASAAQADPADSLLAGVGQFRLDSGKTKTMLARPSIKAYNVCMEDTRGAVPLKVLYEGKETIVAPGECQLIEATKIKLASATKLGDGLTLIGSVGSRSGKHYKTDVSLARVDREE
ncbi:MAG: hypothetical protein ABI661_05045 [Gammaproteobacteria bacterium]